MEKPSKKTFTDYLRLWFKWVLDPLGGFLNRLGLTPNMVTGLGLLGNTIGAIYLARGEMLTGGLWIALMTPVDALDGTMARLRGEASDFGAFVDSVSDRYFEVDHLRRLAVSLFEPRRTAGRHVDLWRGGGFGVGFVCESAGGGAGL